MARSMDRTDGHIVSSGEDSRTRPPFAGLHLKKGQGVDWKRFLEFALLGSSGLGQYAILLVRVSLWLFFAISGANKLFVAGRTQTMYERRSPLSAVFGHSERHPALPSVRMPTNSILAVKRDLQWQKPSGRQARIKGENIPTSASYFGVNGRNGLL